jgi:curved DNA-binding protein CbpA
MTPDRFRVKRSILCFAVRKMFRRVACPIGAASSSSFALLGSHDGWVPFSTSTTRRFSRPSYSEISEALSVLGVDIKTDPKDIKKKYRELVKKHHPDAGGDEKTMSKITVAYERLTSLSKRELEEFQSQKNAYRGGSGGFGGQAQRAYAGYARPASSMYGDTSNDPFGGGASGQQWQQGADFTRAYAQANARATYNYNRGGAFSDNPFRSSGFSMRRQAQSFSKMPFASLVLRGIVAYFGLSLLFLFLYRRYSDYRHDDGWKASESLARHEQMEALQKIRQDLNQRVLASRNRETNPNWQNDFERSRELRVLEYSQKRIMEAQEAEFASWPRFDESRGRLSKKAFDPPGITYFEPGVENEKRRQVSAAFGESRAEKLLREEAIAEAERQKRVSMEVQRGSQEITEGLPEEIRSAAAAIQGMLRPPGTAGATATPAA